LEGKNFQRHIAPTTEGTVARIERMNASTQDPMEHGTTRSSGTRSDALKLLIFIAIGFWLPTAVKPMFPSHPNFTFSVPAAYT
jgi:hypothetical protein